MIFYFIFSDHRSAFNFLIELYINKLFVRFLLAVYVKAGNIAFAFLDFLLFLQIFHEFFVGFRA